MNNSDGGARFSERHINYLALSPYRFMNCNFFRPQIECNRRKTPGGSASPILCEWDYGSLKPQRYRTQFVPFKKGANKALEPTLILYLVR